MKASELKRIKYEREWYELVDIEEARAAHAHNIATCQKAISDYEKKDRPLRILVVHGSGRSSDRSCAHEASNSQTLLRSCLPVVKEIDGDIQVEEVSLRDYNIEYCNCCYSSSSSLCGFPCNCFSLDPMQELYPKILKADIVLCSSGVNQSTSHGRMVTFHQRLISLDGGFFVSAAQYRFKDEEWRSRTMALEATTKFSYDARLFGRVAAYFITSKDEEQPLVAVNHLPEEKFADINFIELTAHTLKDSFESYGIFHDPDYYAGHASEPNVPMMYDKDGLQKDKKAIAHGKQVIRKAVALARKLKANPPEFRPDRINRT